MELVDKNSLQIDCSSYTPTSSIWELPWLCIFANTCYYQSFNFSHFDDYKVLLWFLFAFPWWLMGLSTFIKCLWAHEGEVSFKCLAFQLGYLFFVLLICRNSLYIMYMSPLSNFVCNKYIPHLAFSLI